MRVLLILVISCLLLCEARSKYLNINIGDEQLANDPSMIAHINSVQSSWVAGHNKRFEGMKVRDVKRLCGVLEGGERLPEKHITPLKDLPAMFDSRTQWPNCIGPIRDQGHCGSCWAFGAAEALGDRFCIQSKGTQPLILAPQDLTSCDHSNDGCNGGYPLVAWQWLKTTGIVTEACYPYQMGNCTHPGCSEWPTPKCNMTCSNTATYKTDKHMAKTAYSVARDITKIATEIYTNGPVEAAFTVYEDFNNYKSGVYFHTTGAAEGGHAIKIIGWGVENSTEYWLVANSWNTNWGDQGFFKIRRGTNECGIEAGVVAGLAQV